MLFKHFDVGLFKKNTALVMFFRLHEVWSLMKANLRNFSSQ